MKIVNVVGARPNFIKIAPLMDAMRQSEKIEPLLLHTGQHYDFNMAESFFKELGIPEPDVYLKVGSDTQAKQVAKIMERFDDFCEEYQPDLVLVVGDVNSTIACALVASKRHIQIAHVEAGVRSFDRRMPEEINRILTDSIADILFPPTQNAVENLLKEGVDPQKIHNVGNIMIDTLLKNKEKTLQSPILSKLDLQQKNYSLLTIHRPSNVDQESNLSNILSSVEEIQKQIKIVFPVHPRTQKQIKHFGFEAKLREMENLILTEPLGYFDFARLVHDAGFVMTDSGGIQEETSMYNVPCITLRENTEWPSTIEIGTNELAGSDKEKIVSLALKAIKGRWKESKIPELWDGRTSERIVNFLEQL